MQLARVLWLAPDKNWKRKAEELLIAIHLERTLTKQEIFAYYANQVYLGRLGTFSIDGFGEAARASDRPRSHDRMPLPSDALDPSKLHTQFAGDRIGSTEKDVGAIHAIAIMLDAWIARQCNRTEQRARCMFIFKGEMKCLD